MRQSPRRRARNRCRWQRRPAARARIKAVQVRQAAGRVAAAKDVQQRPGSNHAVEAPRRGRRPAPLRGLDTLPRTGRHVEAEEVIHMDIHEEANEHPQDEHYWTDGPDQKGIHPLPNKMLNVQYPKIPRWCVELAWLMDF